MRIIVAGSSGMIGQLIVREAIKNPNIKEIIALVRRPSGHLAPKVKEVVVGDFTDYSTIKSEFKDVNAAFFCIGVYTGQVIDELFKRITVDYAVAFAKALKEESPSSKLCLLSGKGADQTEKSRTPFARYKGMAENQINNLDLEFYSFRPGYIYPVEKRKEPNAMYAIMRAIYPLLKPVMKSTSVSSNQLAKAMLQVGISGTEKNILENINILQIPLDGE